MVPGGFSSHSNFQQHPAFRASYNREEFCMLNELSQSLCGFLFPDIREFDVGIAERIRRWAELPPCKDCGAILRRGLPVGFCCKPFGKKIISNLPPPMEEELRQRLRKFVASNRNLAWKLNHWLRPLLQNASISRPNRNGSTMAVSGIPYAINSLRQFLTPVCAIVLASVT
jgi:hypothetical protein